MSCKNPLAAILLSALPIGAVLAQNLTVQVVPGSGINPANVWVLLSGSGSADGQLSNGTPKLLSTITGGQFTIAPGSGLGRIYFSFDNAIAANAPFTAASKTRFDWVELTYTPPGVSVANLTAVDQFGIPMRIEAFNGGGASLGSKQWAFSGGYIIDTLRKLAPQAAVSAAGQFARIQAPNQLPSAYASWDAYLKSLRGQTITLSDSFVGVNPPINFTYSGKFTDDEGTIVLSGILTQGGAPYNGGSSNFDITVYGDAASIPKPAPVTIPALTTGEQIYPSNGPYFRSDSPGTYHTAGENNVYSVIYRDLMSGLNNGFIGGKFGNNSTRWADKPAFAGARRPPDDGFYNQFASAIEILSGATIYGYAFSDNTTDPLLTITNAAKLRITILSDSEGLTPGALKFGPPSSVKAKSLRGGRIWKVIGRVSNSAGISGVTVRVLAGRQSHTYNARHPNGRWIARIHSVGNRKALRILVTASTKAADIGTHRYRIRAER